MRSEDGLHLLATSRADPELYAEQWDMVLDANLAIGMDNSINPYDFLDMLEDLKRLMMKAIAAEETVQ